MDIKTTVIPAFRRVIYDTYVNLPVVGLAEGDLAYATDRMVFYRWSGAAWQSVTISSRHGNFAAIGNPAHYPESSLYQADDEGRLYMLIAGAWVYVSGVPSIVLSGLIANIPDAADMQDDVVFLPTDTNIRWLMVSGVWQARIDASIYVIANGTLADFRANAATGTAAIPENVNDNNTGTRALFNAIGKYTEVDFGKFVILNRWRHFEEAGGIGDGEYKIQYWDVATDAWVDWVAAFSTAHTGGWTALTAAAEITTNKIRLICTQVDSAPNNSTSELEVYYV